MLDSSDPFISLVAFVQGERRAQLDKAAAIEASRRKLYDTWQNEISCLIADAGHILVSINVTFGSCELVKQDGAFIGIKYPIIPTLEETDSLGIPLGSDF